MLCDLTACIELPDYSSVIPKSKFLDRNLHVTRLDLIFMVATHCVINHYFGCNLETANVSAFPMDTEPPAVEHDNHMDIENAISPVPNVNEHSYQDAVEEFINNSFNDKDDSTSGHVYFERIK